MKKTALNKLIGILIVLLLIGTSYTIVLASEGAQNAPDEEPPEITNFMIQPTTQTANGYVNISCNVVDNVMVAEVKANITYPDASMQNVTMMYSNITDIAYLNTTYSDVGEYSVYIWAIDNSSNHVKTDPLAFTIEEAQNLPPAPPSNPFPADGATGVATNVILSWECTDPDNDTLLFDVFFGVTSPPINVSTNQLNFSYDPGELEPDTTYYWYIIAKDGNGHSAVGETWSFTTAQESGNISLTLTSPSAHGIWRNDKKYGPGILGRYIFYGPMLFKVNASSPAGIDYVTFKIGARQPETINTPPYTYEWNGLRSGKYAIEIKAYASDGETATLRFNVTKWRIHPALIALGGVAALKGIANIAQGKPAFGWTIVRGTAINVKEQGNDLIFRAFRLHYTEITGSSFSSGVLRLKKVKISDVGLNRMITLGPFGSFSYIFAICKGNLREG